MSMDGINKLHGLGQSIWYDSIQRRLLKNGEIAALIDGNEIKGMTSNPTIFQKAIAGSHDYDDALTPMAWAGWSAEEIFNQLAIEDIRAAADLFLPLYQKSNRVDGYVSLEVSPYLADDTAKTIDEAVRLWKIVDRPNLMIKIPATIAGIEAIKAAIAAGISVNVTLIFSLDRYEKVIDAYFAGLEQRVSEGKPIDQIASVASFFVSRFDSLTDSLLGKIIAQNPEMANDAKSLLGKGAIANARLAYKLFEDSIASDRFQKLKEKGANYQRPLWASTSTKNPAYRDVVYVEELIAPHTINTVPPQTLIDYRDHGTAKISIQAPYTDSQKVLQGLENLGISIKKVTDQLETEGVQKFSESYKELIDEIEKRRAAVQAELGSLAAPVKARVKALDADAAAQKIASIDPSFWTNDPAGQAEIKKRLGWLDAPKASQALIPGLKSLLADCLDAGYKRMLLLGMGGSSLSPEVLSLTFGSQKNQGMSLIILDSTDPGQVKEAENASPMDETLYIVASKSGTTSEIHAYMEYFWAKAVDAYANNAGQHFIAITDPGSKLESLAQERRFRAVFSADPTVGGRYSALIAFGIVPAVLLGLDLEKYLSHAEEMAAQCQPDVPAGRNPGLVLGAVLGEAALHKQDKITILTDPAVNSLGSWLEQLIAESSGKQGKGMIPVDIEPAAPAKSYGNDRLFVYVRNNGSLDAEIEALRAAGHPAITLQMPDIYFLGSEFFRWEYATGVACAVIGVNAFDQPDVQDNKTRTKDKISAYQKAGSFVQETPIWENENVQIFGQKFPAIDQAKSLPEVVSLFLKQTRSGDYVALNAYLPRNAKNLEQLQAVRKEILLQTGCATTLGFGPRFLHSTGQLHKGGPDSGIFLQITADPVQDIDIPEQGITFGTLEKAQALGDLEALLARDRRAIRVHFKKLQLSDLIA